MQNRIPRFAAIVRLLPLLVAACSASPAPVQRTAVVQPLASGTPGSASPPANVAGPAPANHEGEPQIDSDRVPVGTSPVRGRADALVTLVAFSDFQCPFCSRVEPTLHALQERYGDDLRVVWKNNPLPFHANAALAAEAALAAGAQGHFWEMHDMLFANQQALARADLERYAGYLGLDLDRFRADLDSHRFAQEVQADQALATQLGANGTPTFFVNGTEIIGAQPLDRFAAVIDSVLTTARLISPRNVAYARMAAAPLPTPSGPPPSAPTAPAPTLDPATIYQVPVGTSPARGPANALVTLVEFADFQCPFCGRVEATLAQLQQRYGNELRIVWKNQPLEFHPRAMPAAEAAMEAYAQRGSAGFWRFHDVLFQHQREPDGLEQAALETYAQQAGLDMARFRRALDTHAHQAAIRADIALATQVAANGTPHFFVNGRRLVGAQPLEVFTALIDEMRTAARASLHGAAPTRALYDTLTAHGAAAPVYRPAAGDGSPERVYVVHPNAAAPTRGGANARVVLEHFADFQDPFCARVNATLDRIATTYGDRVRIVWRDYPLPFHDHAMLAAEAAREVLTQGGNDAFWRFHDLLFQHQTNGGLDRAALEQYAQQLGLDVPRFRASLDQHTHAADVRADIAAAQASTVEMGTPTTFINGHLVAGAQPFPAFQRVIDSALAEPSHPH